MNYGKILATLSVASLMLGTAASAQDVPEIAFVVNGPSDFWKITEAAVARAQTELPNVKLTFKYPERADAAVQRRMLDDLVAAGVDAIAVSVVDPPTSTDVLNRIAEQIPVFTFGRGFIDQVAAKLQRRMRLTVSVTEQHLYLDVDGESVETVIEEHRITQVSS